MPQRKKPKDYPWTTKFLPILHKAVQPWPLSSIFIHITSKSKYRTKISTFRHFSPNKLRLQANSLPLQIFSLTNEMSPQEPIFNPKHKDRSQCGRGSRLAIDSSLAIFVILILLKGLVHNWTIYSLVLQQKCQKV